MTTYDAGDVTLHRVREHVWEIPREGDMRVPARVLASEALLEEISQDKTLQQLANATHLPGVQNHALCMPDGHQGYGFPVGGVAGIDAEEGCISPGAVGYDINCISGDTNVLLEFGRRSKVRDLADRFEDERATVIDERKTESPIRLFTETTNKKVYEVETATGDIVEATGDHPFLTPNGMTKLKDLSADDTVYLCPFRGVEDEEPPEFVVLNEDDFADEDPQLVQVLTERELLPLKSTDEAFSHLLKLVAYFTGDGSFRGAQTWFYGEPEGLKSIQEDIHAIGFTPSKIYERERKHEINGTDFETTEYSVRATANAFKQLLIRLGAPAGRKVESEFTVPAYLERVADWQKALYLSAFFGAEMSAPSAMAAKNLYCPEITHTRIQNCETAGERFVSGIARHLNDIGVETNAISSFETDSNHEHETIRFRLGIKNDSTNLIRFFTTVGYRYSQAKQKQALVATQYLKRKERVIEQRARVADKARSLADGGVPPRKIKNRLDSVNERFIERSLWSGRQGRPRPPSDFPDFEGFTELLEVRDNLTVETTISSITEIGRKTVYDLGVEHEAHNFVANGFVVSNCGVRMVRTNLTYDDLQGREEDLVSALFANIPSGLGGGGIVESDRRTVDAILDRGMDWAVEEGYATREDMAHCEDEGLRPESDPSKVSDRAKDRGSNQIGSLGSGNHFLEVQRVTDVYRENVAEAFGLEEDQIVVLIHCGSRGLGHQVCTDYLRKIEREHADLLAELPDKELAAAPAGSQLAEDYYGAMGAAINFAWVNRQLITYQVRRVFEKTFGNDWEALGMDLLYDVAHNIVKKEVHDVSVNPEGSRLGGGDAADREERELFVHRKGATRAFPAGHPDVPRAYRDVGQPIIIPGSMGAGSYVLRGGEASMDLTFGSTAHGAGRLMSRTQAKRDYHGRAVQEQLQTKQHVYVKAQSGATIAEEAPGVYKDVDEVVRVSDELGIGDKVVRTFPVVNIKG